jgi:hypothetical protein
MAGLKSSTFCKRVGLTPYLRRSRFKTGQEYMDNISNSSPEINASYLIPYRLVMGQNVSLISPVRKIAASLNKSLEDLNNRK